MQIGINTFGLNELLRDDWEGTLQALKKTGYSVIEPMILFTEAMGSGEDTIRENLVRAKMDGRFWTEGVARERISDLRRRGFQVEGAHLAMVRMIPGGLPKLIPYMKKTGMELGLKYFVHSPQKETIEELQSDITGFQKGIHELSAEGIQLLFHCHYNEFNKDGDITIFDHLMRQVPELKVELDVGWVQFAGQDVLQLMRTYGTRISVLHFKDFLKSDDKDPQHIRFTAVGKGVLPLGDIMKEARHLPLEYVKYIVDQDSSEADMRKDLEEGYKNIILAVRGEES